MNRTVRTKLARYCRSPWYDHSHIHPSLYGFKARRIETLIEIERFLGSRLDKRPFEHQRWIMVDLENSDYDAVFVHSKNPNGTEYPIKFKAGRITASNEDRYASILKDLRANGYSAFKAKGSPLIIARRQATGNH